MSDEKLVIREIDLAKNASALRDFDTSFTSELVYFVVSGEDSLQLQLATAPSPIQKRFPLDLNELNWDQGFAAEEDGKLCGFLATRYEPWNRRLVIVHFYVDRDRRRWGIGRRLMEQAIEVGHLVGARTAWVETSNYNYPGILAYQRLGFSLCGFDLTLYQGTPCEGEFAIYLARAIAS